MEGYTNYQWNEHGNLQRQNFYQPSPKSGKKSLAKKLAKRISTIVLSAALFGGVAGGVFIGVNYAAGTLGETQNSISNVYAAIQMADQESLNTSRLALATSVSDGITDSQSLDVSDIAEGAMPSIVAITNKSVQEVRNYFSMFAPGSGIQQEVESRGSGIIIGQNEDELLIVTNNHVVEGAKTLSVCFIDDEAYEATVKGTNADNDLAVIAVKLIDISEETMSAIKIARIGDSDALKVGQQVVAIGNALGYGQSTTTGIVSALNRRLDNSDSEQCFIQTDAAINPGNSGGALLNMNGEVIGINSAKLASTEVEGMGYAIPVSTAAPIIEDLMNRTTRMQVSEDQASALGISGQTVDSTVSKAYGIPKGVYIGEVNEGSAAEKAGLKTGMIISAFDGNKVESIEELKNLLTYYAAGETVELTVKVADNGTYLERNVTVTLDKA